MTILFKNANLTEGYGYEHSVNILVKDDKIAYVGGEIPTDAADRVIECNGNLIIPAFYNTHCHSAMTLFRGYGDDLPLQRWLHEKIFPAEDRLTSESVYYGSKIAIAEMIRNGTVSFSDMYFFLDDTARAVEECGVKANLSRSLVSFDPDIDPASDARLIEAVDVVKRLNGSADGRIKVDMSLHAEYTNVEKYCRYVAHVGKELGVGMQVHISETDKEHKECMGRRGGRSPVEFFNDCGLFEARTTAAHCVWVTDDDMEILRDKRVAVAHNPVSNLKLGSGVMPMRKMLDRGVLVTLGTDGAASNNNLDVLKEMQYAILLGKGISRAPESVVAGEMLPLVTVNGALAQGRENCGKIRTGYRADAVLVDLDAVNTIPSYGYETTLLYSARGSDVRMTMVDGRVLYENGEYKTIDIEKLNYQAKDVIKHYFD